MKKQTALATILVLALVLTLFTGCAWQNRMADTESVLPDIGTLILRVNPEISVRYNEKGLVTQMEGLNDDGAAIVSGYGDYIGTNCNMVVRDLVREINAAGYFVDDANGNPKNITIQIQPGSTLPTKDFLEMISADVQATVSELDIAGNVVGIGQDDYDIRYAAEGAPSQYITRDKAAAIALAHAGINTADAVFDDREFDFSNGNAVYELEFMSGGKEYEYDIDATTGRVLRYLQGDSGYGASNYDSYYGVEGYGEASPTQPPTPPAASATPRPSTEGNAGYNDTDYGPNSDGVTDYNDTDYGPNSDGVIDYNDTDYGSNSDGVTDYSNTDYGDPSPGSSGYDSGYDD